MFKKILDELIYFLKRELIKYIIILQKIPRKLYVWRILSVRNRWYLSKNFNLYNSTLQATVYPWGSGWNMARFGRHYEGYQSQRLAQKDALKPG